jgi:DNA-binding transcriptional regulator of glucitol operon
MRKLDQFIRRFNQQVAEIQPEGYVLQGSVVKRYLQRPGRDTSKTYGPYYLWTRKINNKTVTHALTSQQAQIIHEAIRRNRQLEQRITRLRAVSEQIILAITPCVVKRNTSLSCS